MTDTLDPHAILAFLGYTSVTSVEPVLGGADAAVWRVEAGGQHYALRVLRPGRTLAHEVATMRQANAGGIPVPEVHAVDVWNGRPAMLMAWCDGKPLISLVREKPHLVEPMGLALGRLQAQLHALPIPDDPATDTQQWIAWAGSEESALQERLRALPQPRLSLLHLDFHPLNVLANDENITGVIDWTNAAYGDPRADLARTYSIMAIIPLPPALAQTALPSLRRDLVQAWQQGYASAAGESQEMALFHAWAGAVLVRDLGQHIGAPGFWMEARDLDPIRQWTDECKRRAGLIP